jgi:hypothetical protein
VDLRWLHDVDQVDQSNPRLRECVADLAATVREIPKDVLVGEHIRQHRHTMRLARSGVTALVVLLIAAVVAAVLAVVRGNQAVAAQHIAIARGMVAQADRIRDRDPRGCPSTRCRSQTVRRQPRDRRKSPADPHVNLPLPHPSQPHRRGVRGGVCPDGRTLATGGADQTVKLWDVSDRDRPHQLGQPLTRPHRRNKWVAFAPDGRTLASRVSYQDTCADR